MKHSPSFQWIILTILLLCGKLAYNQNAIFYLGDKTYPCTQEIKLGTECMLHPKALIVKDLNKGMFVLKSYTKITGTVIMYLEDYSTIKLFDRHIYDHLDNMYYTVYHLTEAEIVKLKSININSIRHDTEFGGVTLKNENHSCRFPGLDRSNYYEQIDFPSIIRRLFQ